jgi:dipeptidase E
LISLLTDGRRAGVIFNAADLKSEPERQADLEEELGRLRTIGLEPEEIDLRDWFGGEQGLAGHLEAFSLIWVRGGNTFVLRRALELSGADRMIADLLRQDAIVYGGYSAGACVLASSLKGVDLVDDPNSVPGGYTTEVVWDGLDVLPYAVAPHYRSDHPESAAVERMVQYFIDHHTPFVALRDGEAIVVRNGRTVVVG